MSLPIAYHEKKQFFCIFIIIPVYYKDPPHHVYKWHIMKNIMVSETEKFISLYLIIKKVLRSCIDAELMLQMVSMQLKE